VVRPSGTEPKLKAYLEAVVPVTDGLAPARAEAAATLTTLRGEMSDTLGMN
jgi:phosphomannomutase